MMPFLSSSNVRWFLPRMGIDFAAAAVLTGAFGRVAMKRGSEVWTAP